MSRGLFVVFEGPDGSGKSTVVERLSEYYRDKGVSHLCTREPGGTYLGEKIRELLLSVDNVISAETETLLYAASRAQHVSTKIIPALNTYDLVICDRFIMSSLAYQGYARDIGIDNVRRINEFATGSLYPDVTIFFDIDPTVTLSRKINGDADRLELEGDSFHVKVYDGYQESLKCYPGKLVRVDAGISKDSLFERVLNIVEEHRRGFR